MAKLKLGPIADDKPVKVKLELPASLNLDLAAYAAVLAREIDQAVGDPTKFIVPRHVHYDTATMEGDLRPGCRRDARA